MLDDAHALDKAIMETAASATGSLIDDETLSPADSVDTDIISSVSRPQPGLHEMLPPPERPVRAGEALTGRTKAARDGCRFATTDTLRKLLRRQL